MTLFLCARCSEPVELENYQARHLTTLATLLEKPLVVHCWKCAADILGAT